MGMRPAWIKGKNKQHSGDLESFPSDSPCALRVCFLFQPQVPRLACSMAVLTLLPGPTLLLFVPLLSCSIAV